MTDDDAVPALERLGLATNEAKVLLGLQSIGTGPARRIAEAADVPRSQVYPATDGLQSRGLLHVQHTNPKEYQALSPDETVGVLRSRLERDLEAAREGLQRRERDQTGADETAEEIWVVRGRESVDARVIELIRNADRRLVAGIAEAEFLPDAVADALVDRAGEGIEVLVIAEDPAIRERFADTPVATLDPPEEVTDDENTSRMLLVDDDGMLHGVRGSDDLPNAEETAFWSQGSGFAELIVSLVESSVSGGR
ncbi:TrmB family transcriptional regulator [Haloparvum sedimenti]|uniref:TrmB family transcriptional regulator n=1 Tax=Haloparvum sedimenti TaxID=1678448 RepID=UPI00071E6C11|nr:helix-turn-helix domain-containing protein [Haloparvum sedimenti]